MPRTLPWLQQQQKQNGTVSTSSTAARRRKTSETPTSNDHTVKQTPRNDEVREITGGAAIRQRVLKRMDTSFVPPNVEYMIPSDDNYIMVEDELCDIAHLFTRSIHRAEYQRLQELALASSKNASTISEIQRPLQGQTLLTNETLAKRDRISKVKQERESDERAQSSDEEERERKSQWEGTNLGALMTSPGRRVQNLRSKRPIKPATRAAAGFHRGRSDLTSQSQSQSQSQNAPQGQMQRAIVEKSGCSRRDQGNAPLKLFKTDPTTMSMSSCQQQKRGHHSDLRGSRSHISSIKEELEPEKTAFSDGEDNDDDDLDSPVITKNVVKSERPHTHPSYSDNRPGVSTQTANTTEILKNAARTAPTVNTSTYFAEQTVNKKSSNSQHVSASLNMSLFDDLIPTPTMRSSVSSGGYKGRAMAALAKKRLEEKKQ